MTCRIPAAIAASTCLLFSPALTVTGAAADTCAVEVRSLTEFMDTANAKRAELENGTLADDGNPLIVTMADGSTVDLRNDAQPARPFESWFGDTVKSKEIEGRIVKARTLAEAETDDGCVIALEKIQIWFDETRGRKTPQ